MDIQGLGESMVELIVDAELATDVADLYTLQFDDLIQLERQGKRSVEKTAHGYRRQQITADVEGYLLALVSSTLETLRLGHLRLTLETSRR